PAPGGPAGRYPRGAAGDPGASRPPGVVPALPEAPRGPAPRADRTRGPGRAVADHAHRLPQGGLSCLLLDRPQVPPRRRAGVDLAWGTGPDYRQSQPGSGATLSGVARRPAQPGAAERR